MACSISRNAGTPEHPGTSRNTPKTRNTPKKTPNTSQKTRNTSECVRKILRIPPRIEVRNRPLMKRQKPRKVVLILQSHKLENFTIFTISKIVTSASHSHISIFLRAYLYERANGQKPRKVILILQSHKLENFTIFTISK